MRLLVQLSGAHPTLPHGELEATFAACGVAWQQEAATGRLLVGQLGLPDERAEDLRPVLDRLGLTHEADQWILEAPRDEEALLNAARSRPDAVTNGDGRPCSFMVRAEYASAETPRKGPGRQTTERVLGQAWGTSGRVDLHEPERVLRAWIADDRVIVGRRVWENDRSGYRSRAPKQRPYFSPVSGQPVLMRAVANLARVRPGGILFDPLVGTGGILIEAGLAGMRVAGSDNDPTMIQGARTNLHKFGLNDPTLFLCDIREAPERFLLATGRPHPDGIATDLPYGQSSSTGGTPPVEVAQWTLQAAAVLLAPGRRLVIGTPQLDWLHGAETHGLIQEARYDVRVHKNLTRSYVVYQRA